MSLDHLNTRLDKLLASMHDQQSQSSGYSVVIYDVVTGEPLPGYEPPNEGVVFWLPKKEPLGKE